MKKTDASFLFSDDAFQSRLKKKKKRKRERERDAKSSALHWLEKDRSLFSSLFSLSSFDFCTLFFALFFAFVPFVSRIVVGKRERESTFVWVVSI